MALLSDSEKVKAILIKVKRIKGPLSFLGYVAGIFGMLLLAKEDVGLRTYFSENALLPASVETNYVDSGEAEQLYKELHSLSDQDLNKQYQWIESQMYLSGLDVYKQNFTVSRKDSLEGRNIYGILRSQRTAGVESIILHIPFQENGKSHGGIALMISLAQYFRTHTYWAKDIIFLVTQHGSYGLRAWLGGYYRNTVDGIEFSKLGGFAGAIQAALTLDMESSNANELQVRIEGSNGALPNLDLVNLVFYVSKVQHVKARLHTEMNSPGSYEEFDRLMANTKNLFAMMAVQASGFPSGVHGEYFRYRIEAVTLKGIATGTKMGGFLAFGRIVESIFRSLNSLQEQFHQSFFFYLLVAHDRFISISLYMIPLGLMLIGPVLDALCLWSETVAEEFYAEQEPTRRSQSTLEPLAVLLVPCVTHLLGYLAYDKLCCHGSSQVLTVGSGAAICICLTAGFLYQQSSSKHWKLRKLVAVVYLILIIVTLSMLNFSLGFLIALFWVPLAVVVRRHSSRLLSALQLLFSALLCPPLLLVAICLLYRLAAFQEELTASCLQQSIKLANSYLHYAVENQTLGVWTLKFGTLILFPLWTLLSSC